MSTRSITSGNRARRGHKERSKNFTELEKRTVLELIARHRDVLRQGRSNNATNRSKQLVWGTICEVVNARCGGERPRTPAQVKMWYENYKKKCKMRDSQQPSHSGTDTPGLLDGMLWQSLHPLDVKEEEIDATTSADAISIKDEDCLPVNMSNGRLSSTNDSDDTMGNVLEPQVQITPHSPEHKHTLTHTPRVNTMQAIEQVRSFNILHKLSELSNTPLNLSSLDEGHRNNGHDRPERYDRPDSYGRSESGRPESQSRPESHSRAERDDGTLKHDCGSATEEERQYFTAKRQHAAWEHEAKMKILSMELRQKEEMFSLQKQLFLIELRLKMDFLEKANAK